MKIVFHVMEPSMIKKALGNIQNLLEDNSLGISQIDLVVVNVSVEGFTKGSDIKKDIEKTISNKVNVKICQNSMNKFGVKKDSLVDGTEIVKSGIVEIIKLQNYGYHYVRI